jgi:hypothetical protein
MLKKLFLLLSVIAIVSAAFFNYSCSLQSKIDYSSQVKPILNKHCIACHGGVKKSGGWSLLFEEEALAKGKSGKYAIIPGNAAESEMIVRLYHKDPEERMPYQKDPLNEKEIEILTQWINEGAKWGEHWAYQPIKKPSIPKTSNDWIFNDIDKFVTQKAKEKGLETAPQADAITLARRLSLDLVGYPERNKPYNEFLKNQTLRNYETFVDNLLASPQYGEKWTSVWLDMARYADTKGYERDDARTIWQYRDWLIKAFNADMPYNQFITEQLAGDMLPKATDQQYIATAFHRNTMTNDEGGTDNEEFRVAAVIDRVNTTWETLLGTTFSCVQCHSHPYDPFKHEEYFKFMAFFNNSRDEDTFDDYPKLRHFDSSQTQKFESLTKWLSNNVSENEKQRISLFLKTLQPTYNSLTCDNFVNAELADTKWLAMRNYSSARLQKVNLTKKNTLTIRFRAASPGGNLILKKGSLNGEIILNWKIPKQPENKGWQIIELPLKSVEGFHDVYFVYQNSLITNPDANGIVFDWFYFSNPMPFDNSSEGKLQKQTYLELLQSNTVSTPIMMENPEDMSRSTHVFERGSWLSKGKKVNADVPQLLGGLAQNMPKNRLGLAQWMTSKKNPLLARTLVNRVWEQMFGIGLVETLEDLGTQGATPNNQELLDYLSYQFIHEYNWSLKRLIKEIVMSATYRQDSKVLPDPLKKDPDNRYFARGPRVRLSAEQIRDQALAVSGVLSKKMYGPAVKPFQPEGIWVSPYNGAKWVKSEGEDQ